MPETAEGYSRIERLFELRRKRYNEGLSPEEQTELNELNGWARDGYGINDPDEATPDPAAATAGPAAPVRPGFDPGTEQAPVSINPATGEPYEFKNFGEWGRTLKDAWKNDPSARFVAKMAGGLLMGGPMGLAGAMANQARAGLSGRGDPTASAAPPAPEAADRAMGWGTAAPAPARSAGLPARAAPALAPAPAGEGPDGGLAGDVADWGGWSPGEDYGGFAGTGEYRMGGYTGEGPDNELQPDEPAGTVHEGEFVIPTEAVEAIGLPTLERLRLMRKPDGGVMATMSRREPKQSGISALDALNDMPRKPTRGLAHDRKLGRVMPMGG